MHQHRSQPPIRTRSREAGFNLAEVLVFFSIATVLSVFSGPPLAGYLNRSKIEGTAYEMSALIRACRSLAITRGANTVVQLDEGKRQVFAFADVHGSGVDESGDGLFNPIAGLPQRLTDYEIARIDLPSGVSFAAPSGETGATSISGFHNSGPFPNGRAIFFEDGSIDSVGAFRVADARGNFFEIATTQRAARVDIRKWDTRGYWLARGDDGAWSWR